VDSRLSRYSLRALGLALFVLGGLEIRPPTEHHYAFLFGLALIAGGLAALLVPLIPARSRWWLPLTLVVALGLGAVLWFLLALVIGPDTQ
jgi:hypothetical protein